MKHVRLILIAAAIITAGAAVTTTIHADDYYAEVTSVHNGHKWVSYEDGMSIKTDMPKFRGEAGAEVPSVYVSLNGSQVGHNMIKDDTTFVKKQKEPLAPGTYELIVRDCGGIMKEPNIGACASEGQDIKDYEVLFNGTITILTPAEVDLLKAKAEYAKMESKRGKMTERIGNLTDELHDMQQKIAHHKNDNDGKDVPVTDNTAYKFGERIYFSFDGPCENEDDRVSVTLWERPNITYIYGQGVSIDCSEGYGVRGVHPYSDGRAEYDGSRFSGWIETRDGNGVMLAEGWVLEFAHNVNGTYTALAESEVFTISLN